jgi:hypothetical protein
MYLHARVMSQDMYTDLLYILAVNKEWHAACELLVADPCFICLKVNINRYNFLVKCSVAKEHPKPRMIE